ncbi:MAG: PIN domain-containing protein [Campylobacterota bacterium]|nr:PIN domain-containing protein [Campylobacterota bacterium]
MEKKVRDKVLLDANIIVRFFEGESALHYQEAVTTIQEISIGKKKGLLLDLIIAEIVYVTRRVYKREKSEIVQVLKTLILMPYMYVENQAVLFSAFDIYASKNIDFADAILCAKKQLEGYDVISFDKKVQSC